jgi:hypothetical protein
MKDITFDGDTEPSSDPHIESDTFPRSEPLTSEARTFAINKKILQPTRSSLSKSHPNKPSTVSRATPRPLTLQRHRRSFTQRSSSVTS